MLAGLSGQLDTGSVDDALRFATALAAASADVGPGWMRGSQTLASALAAVTVAIAHGTDVKPTPNENGAVPLSRNGAVQRDPTLALLSHR